jgi:predicted nucleic acid-binding protein
MIVDTDVLIWYLRGNIKAITALDDHPEINISVVSYIELIHGVRNKPELQGIRSFIHDINAKILHLNEEISSKSSSYVEQYFLSHTIELADALIASTAVVYGKSLLTSSAKHYRPITDLDIIQFKP